MTLENPTSTARERLESEFDGQVVAMTGVGSHARGTASYASDLDVFALVVPDPVELLVDEGALYRDFVCYDIGDGVDVHVWSLQALYDGLMDNDPTAVHGVTSPKQLYTDPRIYDLWEELSNNTLRGINTYSLAHHYRSMAKQNFKQYLQNGNDEVINRLLLVVDALFRSTYIESTGDLPPYEMIDTNSFSKPIVDELGELYNVCIIKKQSGERGDPIDTLDIDTYTKFESKDRLYEYLDAEFDRSIASYDSDKFGTGLGPDTAHLLTDIGREVLE